MNIKDKDGNNVLDKHGHPMVHRDTLYTSRVINNVKYWYEVLENDHIVGLPQGL